MNKRFLALCILSCSAVFISCKNEANNKEIEETYATGTASIQVEESVVPVFDAINEVFMHTYDQAILNKVSNTENQIVNLLLQDSIKLAVLPRKLTVNELKHFEGKRVVSMTPFAKDAVIFITQKSNNDSLIAVDKILDLLKNPNKSSENVFVFDNINSSLSQNFMKMAGITEFGKNVYFAKDTKEVIEYTNKNNKAIGIVGINWLLQPDDEINKLKSNLKSLKVLNKEEKQYFSPTQSTIADGTYPLTRDLYIIEAQGKTGLGKGFSNFAASDIGQRIVLKSGLFPHKQPTREIIIKEN